MLTLVLHSLSLCLRFEVVLEYEPHLTCDRTTIAISDLQQLVIGALVHRYSDLPLVVVAHNASLSFARAYPGVRR